MRNRTTAERLVEVLKILSKQVENHRKASQAMLT